MTLRTTRQSSCSRHTTGSWRQPDHKMSSRTLPAATIPSRIALHLTVEAQASKVVYVAHLLHPTVAPVSPSLDAAPLQIKKKHESKSQQTGTLDNLAHRRYMQFATPALSTERSNAKKRSLSDQPLHNRKQRTPNRRTTSQQF